MAVLRPFQAVRPAAEVASQVAALPYDVVDRYEARAIGEKNPLSFLHVDRAEMDLDPSTDIYAPEVYERARQTLGEWEERGILLQEEKPCYYLYEQTRLGKAQTGVVGCASIDDYMNGVVKKHELTREEKEIDRIHHVDVCNANTGPIFLGARYTDAMKEVIASWKASHGPLYDFVSEDGVLQKVWRVDEEEAVSSLRECFGAIPAFYIADGHHRAASAVKVGLRRRQENPGFTGGEEFNFFLSVVFPFDELTILGYHRVVKDLGGLTEEAFLKGLEEAFQVEMLEKGDPIEPTCKHALAMYVGGKWYRLVAREDPSWAEDVINQLDVEILERKVLQPLLGIGDPRTDSRIFFLGGSHGAADLAAAADKTGGVSFMMFPTSMEDLMKIADEGGLMPPKSTWFEPKLRSGLFIHKLE